jgi:hypothetical protein
MNLDLEVNSLDDIDLLKYTDIRDNIHIIVGGNGRCMCGMYNDNPTSCKNIVEWVIKNDKKCKIL